jgi:hypothetical protein
MDLGLRTKIAKCCTWRRVEFGAETWTWRDHKYLEGFEM